MTELPDFDPFDCFATIQQIKPTKASKFVVINAQSIISFHPAHLTKFSTSLKITSYLLPVAMQFLIFNHLDEVKSPSFLLVPFSHLWMVKKPSFQEKQKYMIFLINLNILPPLSSDFVGCFYVSEVDKLVIDKCLRD
ncbi:hypothetical protein [Bartonella apis]|uniref:hypothetical protein n=1 Tax=Bartonella apis TaxID=1686310 RepID=UPI00242B12BE|nr:hypothetical protein [Bartonella apis]MCT6824834.1 hypothetical protein [Bartonella apis]